MMFCFVHVPMYSHGHSPISEFRRRASLPLSTAVSCGHCSVCSLDRVKHGHVFVECSAPFDRNESRQVACVAEVRALFIF